MSENRISGQNSNSGKPIRRINNFFLACELKPNTYLWKTEFSDFAYNLKPAFIFGKLGVIAYNPTSYSVVKLGGKEIVVGWMFTITNPDSILLMDKLKGFYGTGAFNYHIRKPIHVYTDTETIDTAWVYTISSYVLKHFQSIEGVKDNGFWDYNDEKLFKFMDDLKQI